MSLGRPPRAKDQLKSKSYESDFGNVDDDRDETHIHGNTPSSSNHGKQTVGNGSRDVEGQDKANNRNLPGALDENFSSDTGNHILTAGSNNVNENGGDEDHYSNSSPTGRIPEQSETPYSTDASRADPDLDVSKRNNQQLDDTSYAPNGFGIDILEVIQEDAVSHPENCAGHDNPSNQNGVEIPRKISPENEDELSRQRRVLDFGLYEPPSDKEEVVVLKQNQDQCEPEPESAGLSNVKQNQANSESEPGSAGFSNVELSDEKKNDLGQKKVYFELGGGDDTESDIGSRRSSYEDKPVDVTDGRLQGRIQPVEEYKADTDPEISSNFSPEKYRRRDEEATSPDSGRGFFASPRRRHLSENSGGDASNNNVSDPGMLYKRRVSIDDQGPMVLGENNGRLMKSGSSSSFNSAFGGTGGILKKSPTPARQGFNNADRSVELEPPGVAMSEGLRKYRRRSQLMLSSDIPTDVPLKHRQSENDQRNKNNLEFIKRRVSLTELQPKPTEGPRRNMSSPDYASDLSSDQGRTRRESGSHLGSPVDSGYYGYQGSNPSSPKGNGLIHNDFSLGSHGNIQAPDTRRQSSTGSGESYPREFTDEDIDDCLGNIPAHQRRFGLPPSPQDLVPSGGTPRFTYNSRVSDGYGGSVTFNNEINNGVSNAAFEADEESTMQPYIPMKRQRIYYEDSEQMKRQDAQWPSPERETTEAYQVPRYPSRGSISSLASQASDSASSIGDQRLPSHIRKDSIALFNSKLYEGGGSRLRRLSQVSMAELEQLRRKHMEMTKEELVKKYRLHFFVGLIFLITVLSVSLSWYYRNMATELLYKSQAIFFDPRTRELTLADPNSVVSIRGKLGQDMPPWQLPLHCPIVMGDNPHFKECTWKRNAILRIVHFRNEHVQCYNISWESLHPKHVPYDCFEIETGQWYGPSNQSESTFPIQGKFLFQPNQYTINNNGVFSTVVDFYWLSSKGVGLRVHSEDPIQVFWNQTKSNRFCILSNYTGPFYHQKLSKTAPHMNYTLCNGVDTLKTHLFMQTLYAPQEKVPFPPEYVFKGNQWSLKSIAKTSNVTQDDVINLVDKLNDQGFTDNKITLDGDWQTEHGDLTFDPVRFHNLSEMSEVLTDNDCHVTLCVSPYFHYTSQNFHRGVTKSMFVKDAGGEVTGLTNFQGRLAAVLDVFKQEGRDWFKNKLKDLMMMPSITSHRLTYGSGAWLPYKPYFTDETGTPNMYRKLLSKTLGSVSNFLVVEHTSDSREVTKMLPVVTEIGNVGDRECLLGTIEKALTLGLMGYPFVMADGIRQKRVEKKEEVEPLAEDELPDRDLYIRWLLLSSFFPARQFSVPPWAYGDVVVSLTANISTQYDALLLKELRGQALVKEVEAGLPILRPVWWLDPGNETVHEMEIKDEFLIGDSLLVAPILCKGVTSRSIYVPPGVWEDLRLGNFILGPITLTKYRLGMAEIGLFKRREIVGELGKDDL